MKVACLGNMNQIFFAMTRFLRDAGVNAELLLVDDEYSHFHPSCDSYDEDYRAYTVQLSWGSARSFFRVGRRQILRDLSKYDVVLGCGFAPAFCNRIGRRLDFFVPYGADIYLFPFGVAANSWLKRLPGRLIASYQRAGIRSAAHIYCPDFYAPARRVLQKLELTYERMACTSVYYPQYARLSEESVRRKLQWRDQFDAIRRRFSFLVFSPARQFWTTSYRYGFGGGKGNDVLIRGFAEFLRQSGRQDAALILFEYGADVEASKELCRQCCVSRQVCWLPQMARKELMYGASLADVGADQFPEAEQGGGYGCVGVELMSLGLPVLGRLFYDATTFRRHADFPMPPFLNTQSKEDVASALVELSESPERGATLGAGCQRWVRDYYGPGLVARYIDAMSALA